MPVTAPSQIDIWNEALADIRAETVTDVNENSRAAVLCRLYYPKIVARALEGYHAWSFANRRIQMALAGTNGRPYEWLYAYLLPSDCASPICVLPDLNSLGIAIPIPIPGQPYAETWAVLNGYAMPYVIESGILYCNAENAWLDYTINDITGIPETQLFAAAVALELASKLAVPLKGDANVKKDKVAEAELAWQKAIAVDRNRQPEEWGDYLSEAMVARHCGAITFPGTC